MGCVMGEVVKFKPRYELEIEGEYRMAFAKLTTFSVKPNDESCSPPIKDTAPCEFTAPLDDPA